MNISFCIIAFQIFYFRHLAASHLFVSEPQNSEATVSIVTQYFFEILRNSLFETHIRNLFWWTFHVEMQRIIIDSILNNNWHDLMLRIKLKNFEGLENRHRSCSRLFIWWKILSDNIILRFALYWLAVLVENGQIFIVDVPLCCSEDIYIHWVSNQLIFNERQFIATNHRFQEFDSNQIFLCQVGITIFIYVFERVKFLKVISELRKLSVMLTTLCCFNLACSHLIAKHLHVILSQCACFV